MNLRRATRGRTTSGRLERRPREGPGLRAAVSDRVRKRMILAIMSGVKSSEFVFSDAEVAQIERCLAAMDPYLRDVARRYRMKLVQHAVKGWPGRMLIRRRWLKTYRLMIALNPAYTSAGDDVRWDVIDQWMLEYGEIVHKTTDFRTLADRVSTEYLSGESGRHLISRAIGENFHGAASNGGADL